MKSTVVSYVTSFVFGAAAGTAFAILNAPQSGQKTRVMLRKQISGVRSRTRKAITKVQTGTMEKVDDIQNTIQSFSDGVIHQSKRLRKASQRILEKPRVVLAKVK